MILNTKPQWGIFQNGPNPEVGKTAVKQPQKPQTRGLFSDDEDVQVKPSNEKVNTVDIVRMIVRVCLFQVFPAIPKSRSKPEPTSQGKTSKAASLLFDDEEEEVIIAAAVIILVSGTLHPTGFLPCRIFLQLQSNLM